MDQEPVNAETFRKTKWHPSLISFLSCLDVTTKNKSNVNQVLNSCLIALQNNNVKIKILFQYYCLLIARVGTLLIFGSKPDTCNAMAQKIHEWINYQPISFLNVTIHL